MPVTSGVSWRISKCLIWKKDGDPKRIGESLRAKPEEFLILTDGSENPVGEWNAMTIECMENEVKVWVNGDLVNHGFDCTAKVENFQFRRKGQRLNFVNWISFHFKVNVLPLFVLGTRSCTGDCLTFTGKIKMKRSRSPILPATFTGSSYMYSRGHYQRPVVLFSVLSTVNRMILFVLSLWLFLSLGWARSYSNFCLYVCRFPEKKFQ